VTEPSALLCLTCPVMRPAGRPRRPTTPRVCDGCRERLAEGLTSIPAMFAAVPDYLMPAVMAGERRGGAFGSRPPLNIAALSILAAGEDTPTFRLDFWARDWAGHRRETLPEPAVAVLAPWLGDRLDWACAEHNAVVEFAWDIRDIIGQLRAFRPRETGENAGRCPRKPTDQRCGMQLHVDPYEDTITCERCGAKWNRKDGGWMHLRGQQLAAGMESVEAA
jgi:hypothetical protein